MKLNNIFSKIFGFISGIKFPKFIQNFINNKYAKHFKLDMSEFKKPNEYENLKELFTRKLEIPRQINQDKKIFISPCDGICIKKGSSDKNKIFSIKEQEYDLKQLLSSSINDEELNYDYDFANFYLSPRDYHRYHAPCDLEVLQSVYIPGKLYSVNPKWLYKIADIYSQNERVILKCKHRDIKIWLVFVGALNVGKMHIRFDKRIQSNAKNGFKTYEYKNLFLDKGDEIGNFDLGSSIVLISQKNAINFNLKENENIKFGDEIGKFIL